MWIIINEHLKNKLPILIVDNNGHVSHCLIQHCLVNINPGIKCSSSHSTTNSTHKTLEANHQSCAVDVENAGEKEDILSQITATIRRGETEANGNRTRNKQEELGRSTLKSLLETIVAETEIKILQLLRQRSLSLSRTKTGSERTFWNTFELN